MALKYGDFRSTCQMVSDATQNKQTTESLKRELEKESEQTRYWKECYEIALKELSECDHSRQ